MKRIFAMLLLCLPLATANAGVVTITDWGTSGAPTATHLVGLSTNWSDEASNVGLAELTITNQKGPDLQLLRMLPQSGVWAFDVVSPLSGNPVTVLQPDTIQGGFWGPLYLTFTGGLAVGQSTTVQIDVDDWGGIDADRDIWSDFRNVSFIAQWSDGIDSGAFVGAGPFPGNQGVLSAFDPDLASVPEPGTFVALVSGVLFIYWRKRRR